MATLGWLMIGLSAAASLLVATAGIVLWIASFQAGRTLAYLSPADAFVPDTSVSVEISRGRLKVCAIRRLLYESEPGGRGLTVSEEVPAPSLTGDYMGSASDAEGDWGWSFAGLSYCWSCDMEGCRSLLVPAWAVPLPPVALVSGFGVWAIHHRQRRVQRTMPRCIACGYDLRATPGRCPECGVVRHAERPI